MIVPKGAIPARLELPAETDAATVLKLNVS
jgi:hypothetical protein